VSKLSIGHRWLHRANGQTYSIVCNATYEPDLSPVVVYLDEDGRLWVRPTVRFLDGRFQYLGPPED
jgi:hypothetical protein